ncbi:AAA family ATPase [Mesorhizobium sp. B2-5-7]|uniref:AAA family ATPase n=1 Tax=Mesorhizobium sp. B2-5-7 TaxID=2589923 RepID=UPI00112DF921|nr:AAA family ATPase [Mesorhizobium sp. B2-5-7]TPK11647.1 AAA family ATPase [Mesorhizobium sp. B2-5-7]
MLPNNPASIPDCPAMTFRDSTDRHFDRRQKAAKAGLHLPSEDELLRGMNFFGDRLEDDIREYSSRLSRRMRKRGRVELLPLASCLDDLAVEQSEEGIKSVEAALVVAEAVKGIPAEACRLRCQFYLASFGDPQAAAAVAGETASMAMRDVNESRGPQMLWRALAWSMLSRTLFFSRCVDVFHIPRHSLFRMLLNYEAEFESAILNARPEDERTNKEASAKKASRDDDIKDLSEDDAEAEPAPNNSVVVIRSIGNSTTSEGKRVSVEFQKFVQRGLPLPAASDLPIARMQLVSEFPWVASVADDILTRLVGRGDVHLRPTILVGSPGCGKTRFARRLVEELGIPYELVSCGGLSDSAVGGTARRWSSGEPSLAIMAVRRHECAGPAIILDEIEKVGTSRHNGNVHDVLIGLLEKESSSRWFDPYVEANCDLSHVSWLMTANEVASVSAVLKDRCRILRFPEPGPDQLPFLASRILERLYVEAGHDPRWARPLEGFELTALANNWPGGSIRKLERLLEKLIEARERYWGRQ